MRKIIRGNINLQSLHLYELFDLSDVEVRGYFDCTHNHLINLKGSPHTVGKEFRCNNSDLTSLEGGPHTVGGSFYCYENSLTSLKGAPQTLGEYGRFTCNNNKLTNLIGAPQIVGGAFYCHRNNLTSLKGIPKTIEGSFYISEDLKEKFPEEYIRSLSNIEMRVLYW